MLSLIFYLVYKIIFAQNFEICLSSNYLTSYKTRHFFLPILEFYNFVINAQKETHFEIYSDNIEDSDIYYIIQ